MANASVHHRFRIGVIPLAALSLVMGGQSQPACKKDTGQSACSKFQDMTDPEECPDLFLGGGTCGVKGAAAGKNTTCASNPDCLLIVSVKDDVTGECELAGGVQSVAVSGLIACGEDCPQSGGGVE